MFSSLTQIRGVGDKLAEKLVQHYGSEKEALASLEKLELERLFSLDAPQVKLAEIAREIYSKKLGFEYANVLKTQEARGVYSQMLDLLKEFAQTEYAKLRLSLFYPTRDEAEIERRLQYAKKARDFAGTLSREHLQELKKSIGDLRPLNEKPKKKRITRSAVAIEDRELHKELSEKYGDAIEVFLLESQEDIEYLKDYESVRYVQTRDAALASLVESLPNVELLPDSKEENVLPEATLAFFGENRKQIIAAIEAAKTLGKTSLSSYFADASALDKIAEKIKLLQDGELSEESSEKFKKFSFALKNLQSVADACLKEANAAIENKAESGAIALRGREMLKMLASAQSGELYEHLPKELSEMLRGTASEFEEESAKRLGMQDERLLFSGLFSEQAKYPLEASQEKLREIETFLSAEKAKLEMKLKRELAKELGKRKEEIRRLVAQALELDLLLALGEFSLAYDASLPEINKKQGIAILSARHLQLAKRGGEAKVQPVDYAIGSSEIELKGAKGERIVILTGANSGGKTTLLETVLQVQIAAQCGLPVAAKRASAALIDEIYFFAKSKGSGDAGAFESLLKSFAELSKGRGRRLILADEIEATTEPGAAAKIISALLEWFAKDEGAMIAIVTHLGEDIAKLASAGVRIDGIEASGLDENLNLIVNRNPALNRLAKSTPELIVEKLSRTEKRFADFYRHVLSKFK